LSDTWVLLLIGILIGLSGLAVALLVLPNRDDDAFRWPWSYKRFDQYDLSSVLQRSELSTVYLANTPEHGRVTLTVLDDPYASEPAQAESFLSKGRTLKQIHETDPDAPLIDVYRVGRENDAEDGRPFLVLEHLEGDSLLSHLKDIDTLDTGEALSITRQVCSALQVAHNNNVHHGNLTPENVVVTQTDPYRIKLVGFGLQSHGATPHDLTGGTTSYLAPEQLRDGRSDWRSDMYAVGMLFYKLVTGAPPHMSDSSTQMLEYQTENPTPPLPDHIPDHVKPVFHRMISNDPDRRPTATRVISVLDLLQSTT
jgi:serine/threonine protein kinase